MSANFSSYFGQFICKVFLLGGMALMVGCKTQAHRFSVQRGATEGSPVLEPSVKGADSAQEDVSETGNLGEKRLLAPDSVPPLPELSQSDENDSPEAPKGVEGDDSDNNDDNDSDDKGHKQSSSGGTQQGVPGTSPLEGSIEGKHAGHAGGKDTSETVETESLVKLHISVREGSDEVSVRLVVVDSPDSQTAKEVNDSKELQDPLAGEAVTPSAPLVPLQEGPEQPCSAPAGEELAQGQSPDPEDAPKVSEDPTDHRNLSELVKGLTESDEGVDGLDEDAGAGMIDEEDLASETARDWSLDDQLSAEDKEKLARIIEYLNQQELLEQQQEFEQIEEIIGAQEQNEESEAAQDAKPSLVQSASEPQVAKEPEENPENPEEENNALLHEQKVASSSSRKADEDKVDDKVDEDKADEDEVGEEEIVVAKEKELPKKPAVIIMAGDYQWFNLSRQNAAVRKKILLFNKALASDERHVIEFDLVQALANEKKVSGNWVQDQRDAADFYEKHGGLEVRSTRLAKIPQTALVFKTVLKWLASEVNVEDCIENRRALLLIVPSQNVEHIQVLMQEQGFSTETVN